ncbi:MULTISPECIES: hypothetical protein [unclassified Bradyrhizobium]|uniref:hypothetical protein n=1 Tax=unclassified Bradyrhizobium TaxID=2631580 RepID=UPI0028E4CCFF|nr:MULTISPECIES: hypothetical protein [unclassified Bradyrhizobium]
MVSPELAARWTAVRASLGRAQTALPAPPLRHVQACAKLYEDFAEYLEHNELALALDALMELGRLTTPPGGFWRDLERAAEIMNLDDRILALREAFRAAPMSQDDASSGGP